MTPPSLCTCPTSTTLAGSACPKCKGFVSEAKVYVDGLRKLFLPPVEKQYRRAIEISDAIKRGEIEGGELS